MKIDHSAAADSGIHYRRAKTWQIALSQMNSGASMCFYILLTYASYVANSGYGIATAVVGIILTLARVFDGITDPIIALLIDKSNSKHGKIRFWLLGGWAWESLAVCMLYIWASGKGHGIVMFLFLYIFYIIGYTMNNMCGQIIAPVMVNDPKQRPLVGVWGTVYNYFIPMLMNLIFAMIILPRFGNQYTLDMLASCCKVTVAISFVLVVMSCIGVSHIDKPENFQNVSVGKKDKVKVKDMISLLKSNRPLQMYIAAAASDKLAQQTATQSIVITMLYGILIGNIQFSTMLSVLAMLPSIAFAIIGGKYAGSHGSKEAITRWTWICIFISLITIVFLSLIDMKSIAVSMIPMVIFFALTLLINGCKMSVTTATSSMCADVIDYEMARSGKFMPATVTATYSFLDKLISSLGAMIATACVAMIGYTNTMPQPTDPSTAAIKGMTLALFYGLPIIGWICTLIAMKFSPLSKEKMIEVQEKIASEKTDAAVQETIKTAE
jgi:Na+/melibiose symporter-like transporter